MPFSFRERKAKILSSLERPDEQYHDLSPKGSVDVQIRELIAEINVVYLEGNKTAKGGGQWLFTSHEPHESPRGDGELLKRLGFTETAVTTPLSVAGVRFVHFKFEPLILHILAADSSAAQRAVSAALSAGFRESGITGPNEPSNAKTAACPMVAVRSSGLALDSIIGYCTQDKDAGCALNICPMVSESYLRVLFELANARFVTNAERTRRFQNALERACNTV